MLTKEQLDKCLEIIDRKIDEAWAIYKGIIPAYELIIRERSEYYTKIINKEELEGIKINYNGKAVYTPKPKCHQSIYTEDERICSFDAWLDDSSLVIHPDDHNKRYTIHKRDGRSECASRVSGYSSTELFRNCIRVADDQLEIIETIKRINRYIADITEVANCLGAIEKFVERCVEIAIAKEKRLDHEVLTFCGII